MKTRGNKESPELPGTARVRRGIRFHLFLAVAFLTMFALAVDFYSSQLTKRASMAGADQDLAVQAALNAAHEAFDIANALPAELGDLARARGGEIRQAKIDGIDTDISSIRSQLSNIFKRMGQINTTTLSKSSPSSTSRELTTGNLQAPDDPASRIRFANDAVDALGRAVRNLDVANTKRLAAGAALVRRMDRLRANHDHHFDASTRIEITMRALASRTLSVDLVHAGKMGQLQQRIDDLLEREFSWVATAQDLVTDSRELMDLAERLAVELDSEALRSMQHRLMVYSKRLEVYKRLPSVTTTHPLGIATTDYVATIDVSPSLADLRRQEITTMEAVTTSLGVAVTTGETLSSEVYNLAQDLAEQERYALGERQRTAATSQQWLQGSTVGIGLLVLGLIGYYLNNRIIYPLERLTKAMQQHSRNLVLGSGSRTIPNNLPEFGSRRDEVGVMTQALRVLHDTLAERESALLEQQERLNHLAQHDALTNLPNRALLSDRIEQAMTRVYRYGKLLAVGLLDLDGFKAVNDRLGHDAGDALLIAVAQRLKATLRECDTLARLGGDELAIVIPDLNTEDDAEHTIGHVLRCFSTPFDLPQGRSVTVGASIGYTLFPQDQGPGDVLMRHADQAMYAAKHAGKGRAFLYDATRDRIADLRHSELARIEQAIDRGELTLYYQPMVDLRDGHVVGVEALLRWQHPERGLLEPSELLHTITGTELSVRLGSWVLATAVRQGCQWQHRERSVFVSVNLTAEQLRNECLIEEIRTHFESNMPVGAKDLKPPVHYPLQLEIVETASFGDIDRVARILSACRAAGVQIVLDDFGTGYSSLTHVRQLTVDTIKIHHSFVLGMLDNREDRLIVEAVIALAHALGHRVMAEGVESEAQAHALLGLGCHLAQGFWIARPMPAEAMSTWLDSSSTQLAFLQALQVPPSSFTRHPRDG